MTATDRTGAPRVRDHSAERALGRPVDPPRRGPEVPARPGRLHRRPDHPGHAARRRRCAARTPHARIVRDRHRRGAGRCPACTRSITGARGGGAVRPDARLRPGPGQAHLALPGRGQGPLRRRGRRGGRRGQPLPGRGRARADRGRVRAAAGRSSTRSAALDAGSPLVHEALGVELRLRAHASTSATSTATSPAADVVVRDRLRWHRSGGQPLETVGAIAELRPRHRQLDHRHQHAELHQLPVHGRGHAQGPGQQARHQAACRPAAASAPSCSPTRSR